MLSQTITVIGLVLEIIRAILFAVPVLKSEKANRGRIRNALGL